MNRYIKNNPKDKSLSQFNYCLILISYGYLEKTLLKIVLIFFLLPRLGEAQTNKFTKIKLDTIKDFHYYINIGAGLVNGGRLDFIFKFSKTLSAEISYGADVRNFIINSDEESRFTLGVNWHSQKSFPLIISLLTTYAKSPSDSRIENPRYLISINGGYLNMKNSGMNAIARLGLYIEYYKYFYPKEIKYGGIHPNLELGVGWIF